MTKILNNFIKATEELEEYLGIENILYHSIECDDESYFTIFSNGDFGWADSLDDLEKQDGEYYQEEIIDIKESFDLTAVLFNSGCGEGDSWIIFNNNNKVIEIE